MRLVMLLVLLAAELLAAPAQSKTIFVPNDSVNLQSVVASALSGDTVLVSPGIYVGNIDFGGKTLSLKSAAGPGATTIHGVGGTTVAIGGTATIEGFTITGGTATFGAGMSVSGSGTVIRRNIFEGNSESGGGFGAAIGGNSASPIIEMNIFQNNSSDGQFLAGVVSFVNSSSPVIINNIFKNNNSRAINLTLPVGNSPLVENNTIVGNAVGIRVDRRVDSHSYLFRNNILYGNGIGLEVDFGGEANNPTWENNLVFANLINYDLISDQTGLAGNLSSDPRFIDPIAGMYDLLADSPALDAGTAVGAPTVDFLGRRRPTDGNLDGIARFDIGAFEMTAVPEPGPASLILLGLAALLLLKRTARAFPSA